MSEQSGDQPLRDARDDTVYRHGRAVRITHWTNAILIFALLLTGFGISQLHLPIYWGDAGQDWGPGIQEFNAGKIDPYPAIARAPEMPWQDLRDGMSPRAARLGIGSWFDDMIFSVEDYLRNPSRARDHIFLAWLFLFNGLIYLAAGLWTGRFRGLLRPSRRDFSWRLIRHELWSHIRLRFPKGDEARAYNVIQKYTYLTMIFVVLPLQLLTGLGLMPWMDAAFPWFKDIFFGRQSMRTIHFICSFLILGFVLVHVAMVLLSGFRNNIRSMITGWYRLPRER
jgi:thiosulfate reductase cytochrome b subunit